VGIDDNPFMERVVAKGILEDVMETLTKADIPVKYSMLFAGD
jgi:hypothetical protein